MSRLPVNGVGRKGITAALDAAVAGWLSHVTLEEFQLLVTLLISAVASAFAGAFIGSKLLKKITLNFVQWTVTIMIVILAIGLGTGLL